MIVEFSVMPLTVDRHGMGQADRLRACRALGRSAGRQEIVAQGGQRSQAGRGVGEPVGPAVGAAAVRDVGGLICFVPATFSLRR